MPAYAPHTLVAFGGVLNSAADVPEIWQCGVRVTDVVGGGPLANHTAYLAGIHASLGAWFSGVDPVGFCPMTSLNWIKANPINAAGKYASDTTYLYDYPDPVAGGISGPALPIKPDILSVVLSWSTAKARGKSHAGRIYLPNYLVHTVVDGSMRITAGDVTGWVTKGVALLGVLANSAVKAVPIIASSAGPTAQITGVRVGNVLDVQRRRKDALREAYTSAPFAPA